MSINCSSCGAPIDLQTETRCASCGSSLAVVDPVRLGDALRQLDADARAAAPALRPGSGQALRPGSGQALRPGSGQAVGAPPPIPPDEIIADWRAEEEGRRRLEAGLDDANAEGRPPIDLLDVGVTLLSRLLGK